MKYLESNICPTEILDYEKRGDCYTWCFPINFEDFDAHDISRNNNYLDKNTKLMTLYIHIPYCKFICSMCPFTHEPVKEEEFNRYVKCLEKEIKLYASHKLCKESKVSTIYFGGGTASILSPGQVKEILCILKEKYQLIKECEICLECHPNTVTKEYLEGIKEAGVTRISFGIQSFQQKNLTALKLWQNAERNKEVIKMAVGIGFNTVAMDLMYNFPDQTIEELSEDIKFAVDAGVQGLSLYALDPEVRKLNSVKERQEKMQMEHDMFYYIYDYLKKSGYVQVAQPDYSLPGHENKQIIDLWGAPQKINLGFGAGAFSENFNGCSWANIHAPLEYMKCMEAGQMPILMGKRWSLDDAMARYVALGVRMLKVPLKNFKEQFGIDLTDIYKYEILKLQELGYVEIDSDYLIITEKGKYYIDNISKTFFNFSNRGRTQYWGCKLKDYMPRNLYLWKDVMGECDEE